MLTQPEPEIAISARIARRAGRFDKVAVCLVSLDIFIFVSCAPWPVEVTFTCLKRCDRCSQSVPIGETIIIQIEFHDGERLDVKLRIIRAEGDLRTRENLYAGLAEEGISAERIAKEQAYLLRQYPDFARASRARSLERMQATVQEPQK